MKVFGVSMRVSLGAIIGAMGALGMVLVLVTGEYYRQVAIDSHRVALAELVKLKADDLIAEAVTRSSELSLGLQHKADFAALVVDGDVAALKAALDSQFHQYFVTAGVIKLARLAIYNRDLQLVVASSEGRGGLDAPVPCQQLVEGVRKLDGAQRRRNSSDLCVGDGNSLIGVLVPIGGLRLAGYVLTAVDLPFGMKNIESAIGMPVRILNENGQASYQSPAWPRGELPFDTLIVEHDLRDASGTFAARVEVVANVKPFYDGLRSTRDTVLMIAGFVTMAALLLSTLLLQRTTLNPLQILTRQLQLLRTDKKYLGEHVSVGGNAEIRGLAKNFNKMTTELKALYSKLERIAYVDPVTQLANRARFHDILQIHAERNRRAETPFALMIVDVHRFKSVNDALGHEVGDQLLIQIGDRLDHALRRSDIAARVDQDTQHVLNDKGHSVARLGGDEFAVLLPGIATREQACVVASKIRAVMSRPFVLSETQYEIGTCIGTVLAPEHGQDAGTLLRHVDVAVSEAKKRQLDHYIYDDESDQHRLYLLMLERDLRVAIMDDGLELHYQPQVSMTTPTLWGIEALVRWRHRDKGLLSPERFIPLAEQSGLIHSLTVWVLRSALAYCAALQREGIHVRVSVNLSAKSLREQGLPSVVLAALNDAGVAANYLVLEITESAVMSDPDQALRVLTELKAMGVSLSIDDFGTGYSSMSYLRRLPVDEIKIDRSFVTELVADGGDEVIVRSVIDLAHNMGLRAVAEGVESDKAWSVLSRLGCDIAQGFGIATPMPSAKLKEWMSGHADRWQASTAAPTAIPRD